ncbi:MAG: cytidylate kinase family protein [archaeon]
MIITISGAIGSGKSNVGDYLADKLRYKHFSIGDLMGDVALDKKVTLLKLSKQAEESDEVDHLLDEKQKQWARERNNFVIDSRLGFHFMPNSFKIRLECDEEEAAKRIFNDPREDETDNTTLEVTLQNIRRRKKSEALRYLKYYNLNPADHKHYDFVLDTTNIPEKKVWDIVLRKVLEAQKNKNNNS